MTLLAPKDVLEKEMEENHSEFVPKELIDRWLIEPENVPGRLVSRLKEKTLAL